MVWFMCVCVGGALSGEDVFNLMQTTFLFIFRHHSRSSCVYQTRAVDACLPLGSSQTAEQIHSSKTCVGGIYLRRRAYALLDSRSHVSPHIKRAAYMGYARSWQQLLLFVSMQRSSAL